MKRAEIKLLCLSMFFLLVSITSTNANDRETIVYDETSERISEAHRANQFHSLSEYDIENRNRTIALLYGGCYAWKRVWTWAGWRPKRVLRYVKVNCPQTTAAASRGPGTTIPPH